MGEGFFRGKAAVVALQVRAEATGLTQLVNKVTGSEWRALSLQKKFWRLVSLNKDWHFTNANYGAFREKFGLQNRESEWRKLLRHHIGRQRPRGLAPTVSAAVDRARARQRAGGQRTPAPSPRPTARGHEQPLAVPVAIGIFARN